MICVLDYGVGNVQAFLNTFKRLDLPARRARAPQDLADATRLILPGVGAFDHAMNLLHASGLLPPLKELVLRQRVPVLGVCVGMQMLADGSDEGQLPGLGWIPGRVRAFAKHPASAALPMPHMGWNDVRPVPRQPLFQDFDAQPRFYFLHSYYFDCADPSHVAARALYGLDFHCAVSSGHIHGVQCHPEKSHHWGAQLLKNFASS